MAERAPTTHDVAVLGGGMGGYVAAIRAAQLGLTVAVVEDDKVGGTCLHRGCIPTKALLQSAALVDAIAGGKAMGVRTGSVDVDYGVVGKRRDSVVSQLHRGVEFLLKKNKVTTVHGRGRLEAPGVISVSSADTHDRVEAKAVILATGSRVKPLPGIAPDGRHILTSDDALRLDHIPASAIVVGAGAVGVEFASLWRSLGAAVTVVEMMDRLVPLEDEAVGEELGKRFRKRGIECLTGATLDLGSVSVADGAVSMTVSTVGEERRLTAEVLLMAAGRAPNVEDIGLEKTGVPVERGFVHVDALLRTGVENVYAIGDLIGGFQLAHKAAHEGIIAAEVIAGVETHALEPNQVPRTTYCAPQIASLGLTEKQARDAGHDVKVGVMPFRGNGRALIWGEAEGFCKVVGDGDGNTLGVHIIGHEVTELIWGPALGMLLEATPWELGRSIAPHPTLSEVLTEASLALSGQAIHI